MSQRTGVTDSEFLVYKQTQKVKRDNKISF